MGSMKSVRTIPSPHSLSSLLCKNTQIVSVGSEVVESMVGTKAKHLLYDIDRNIIQKQEELIFSRSPTIMTPKEKKISKKCVCGKQRVFPPKSNVCIHCLRSVNKGQSQQL